MSISVNLDNVSKSYRMYKSPSEKLKEILHPFSKSYARDFWALRDISFKLKRGESIGIIGRNGSGKSTLLQLLCGVMQPTKGEVSVNGRISALLELGTGFNPEFTGRENVYMNGAISGFTKKEMDERFSAIEDFADIGDFIEQPVKTFSSGMHVRLGFACAVHVDPDILVVDEVLSVGDFKFRQKCSQKINELRRTASVILVSHNMRDIMMLCSSALVIDGGKDVFQGTSEDASAFYMQMMNEKEAQKRYVKVGKKQVSIGSKDESNKSTAGAKDIKETEKDVVVKSASPEKKKKVNTDLYDPIYHNKEKITDVEIRWVDESGNAVKSFSYGKSLVLEFSFTLLKPTENLVIGIPVYNSAGHILTAFNTDMNLLKIDVSEGGCVKGKLHMEKMIFNPGAYSSAFAVVDGREYLYRDMIDEFNVTGLSVFHGLVTPSHSWEFYNDKGMR